MFTARARSTEFLPVLSRGKHRRPRSGACLMEYASYLAGERWSDHPACTPPLLAELARQVNDFTSDEGRQALIELVPDMIGVAGAELRIELRVALRAARTALPIVAEENQRIMAVGILTCERLMADLEGRPGSPLTTESLNALALAPSAAGWATGFTRRLKISRSAFRRETAPTIVRYAVQGIGHACVPGRDAVLRDLLKAAIEDCKSVDTAAPTGRRTRARTTGAASTIATGRVLSDNTTA
jgi:hypothetical protein